MADNPQNLTIQKIDIKAVNRQNVDIASWRNATRSADRGRKKSLYDLYEDLLLDNVLEDAIDKRITAITNAEITFTRDGEPVELMDTIIDSQAFEELLREIMLAKFWGVSLVEFEFLPEAFKIHSIPRKHIRAAIKEVAINEGDDKGVPYNEDFFLEVGSDKDLGMMLRAAPFVIYKRNGMGDWAQYVELFGMPMRTAYYDAYDEQMRIELNRAFEAAGSALVNILPKGTELKIEESTLSGDGEVYNKIRAACNEELLIGILGQTMTTLDGSSKAQGEVHLQVQEDKHKADRRFVQRILNSKLLPMLERRGYPVSGGYFYFPEAGESIKLAERIAIDTQLIDRGLQVSTQYLYDTYGIAKPIDNEEVLVKPSSPAFELPPVGEEPQEAEEAQNSFLNRLRSFFAQAPQVGASKSALRWIEASADDPSDNFDQRLIKRVARGEADYFDSQLFESTSHALIEAFTLGWAGKREITNELGVEYGVANSAVITANETNLYHFSAAKTLAQIQQLNQLYRESKSFEEYYQKATALCGKYNKTWARVEYQTARLVAESSATYHRLKAQANIFPYWEYRTVGDDKVREEHAALDGVILPANDPRWQKIYPPNGWKCRCRVTPKMAAEVATVDFKTMQKICDDYFNTPDWSMAQAQGFDINRAEANQVFGANQMYIRKFPNNAAKYLDKLNFKSYNLPSYTNCLKSTKETVPLYDGTAKEWFDSRQKNGKVILQDAYNRELVLSATTFKTHTTGTHISRVKYLQSLPRALKSPDEIWLNAERGKQNYENYTLIKYYQDEMIVINCRVNAGVVNEIRTWYPIAAKAKVIDNVRRGLLIYKKGSQ